MFCWIGHSLWICRKILESSLFRLRVLLPRCQTDWSSWCTLGLWVKQLTRLWSILVWIVSSLAINMRVSKIAFRLSLTGQVHGVQANCYTDTQISLKQHHTRLVCAREWNTELSTFLLILLLCELKMKRIDLRLDECLPYISGSISINRMSRDVESIISRILWLAWLARPFCIYGPTTSMASFGDLLTSCSC